MTKAFWWRVLGCSGFMVVFLVKTVGGLLWAIFLSTNKRKMSAEMEGEKCPQKWRTKNVRRNGRRKLPANDRDRHCTHKYREKQWRQPWYLFLPREKEFSKEFYLPKKNGEMQRPRRGIFCCIFHEEKSNWQIILTRERCFACLSSFAIWQRLGTLRIEVNWLIR